MKPRGQGVEKQAAPGKYKTMYKAIEGNQNRAKEFYQFIAEAKTDSTLGDSRSSASRQVLEELLIRQSDIIYNSLSAQGVPKAS